MNKFAGVFAPMTEVEKAATEMKAAVGSVQSSLYQRLKKKLGARSGAAAWMLIRVGQEWHEDHEEAVIAVGERSFEELSVFIDAVRVTQGKANGAARSLLDEIAGRLSAARTARARESEAG